MWKTAGNILTLRQFVFICKHPHTSGKITLTRGYFHRLPEFKYKTSPLDDLKLICSGLTKAIEWNPSFEATPFAPEKWPFKRGDLSSGLKINTY